MPSLATLAYVAVAAAILYYVATQRAGFAYQLTQEIRAPPQTCIEFVRKHGEEVTWRSHPYVVKIEKLNVKETADYVHIEENMYERVPLIPYLYTTEVSLHVFYELDIQRRMSHYRVKNEEGPNDFLGTRINITLDFAPHPEVESWTMLRDTISNDFSYIISFFSTPIQRGVHEKLLQDMRDAIEEYATNQAG